jgi:hypothetical protein
MRGLLAASMALAAALPSEAAAQTQAVVGDEPLCETCTLTMSVLATLGTADGTGALSGKPFTVFSDSRGRYWVVAFREAPMVFAADGQFLQRAGRMGQGPGEFRWPRSGGVAGDTVFVFDSGHRSLHIIGPDLQYSRSVALGPIAPYSFDLLEWPSAVLFSGLYASSDNAGFPLHVLDVSGRTAEVSRSFGSDAGVLIPSQQAQEVVSPERRLARVISVANDGRIWSAYPSQLILTQWSHDGEVLGQIKRVARWFPESAELGLPTIGTPEEAPRPWLTALRSDEADRLWIYAYVPSPDWRDAWTPAMREDYERRRQVTTPQGVPASLRPADWQVLDTVIEVLDPTGRGVVVRRRLPHYVIKVFDDGRVATYAETEHGVPFIQVLSVSLAGRGM